MNKLTKYRIFNKYRVWTLLIFVLGFFLSWFFSSHLYELIFKFNFNAPDVIGHGIEDQKFLINILLNFDDYVSSTFEYTTFLMPVFVCLLSIIYIKEKKGLLLYKYIRTQKLKKTLLNSIFTHSLYNAFTLYLGFVIFLVIGLIINKNPVITDRTFLNSYFGNGFYFNHPVAYFLIEGIIKFFIFTFVYSIFTFSISLVTNKMRYCIIIPIVFYLFTSIIFGAGMNIQELTPAFTQGFSSYVSINPLRVFIPLIIPILISVFLTIYHITRSERVEA
ncbi:hypothetical protein [Clostridium estertheticum]|uniref:hypothetical protein n=1 Tax=Clostridium estertheticum TaxID=238834 RepID=UPI001CF4DB08|nr:hypothetical protein [Clostridium estertheticum]MCB2356554.1 hypothetical protein [Clostridium estertheticum]WAG43638.1 hypothetical protein LL065_24860 [Clostridium estertheticum]